MRKCLYSRSSIKNMRFGIYCMLMFSIFMFALALYVLIAEINDPTAIFTGIMLLLISCIFVFLSISIYINGTHSYSVDSQGITVFYPNGRKYRYFWLDVEYICVCDTNHSTRIRDVFDVSIRIAVEKEKGNPFDDYPPLDLAGIECWRSYGSMFFRYPKAIILDYSDERLEEIKKASGKEIYDFLTPRARERGWYEDDKGNHQPLPKGCGDGFL